MRCIYSIASETWPSMGHKPRKNSVEICLIPWKGCKIYDLLATIIENLKGNGEGRRDESKGVTDILLKVLWASCKEGTGERQEHITVLACLSTHSHGSTGGTYVT